MVALALTLMFGAGPALFGPTAASASVLPAQTPAVLSASATPSQLPATGGTVTVTARVANASSCQLQLLSSPSLAVVYSHNPKSCADGTYSAHVTIGPNPTTAQATVGFALVVRSAASSYSGQFYVLLAGAAPAAVLSAGATPSQVPATGGTVTVTARVANATSCQLQLLSSQSFAVVYSHNPKDCSGNYSARVTIGPNTTAVARTVAFALVARNAASGPASTARLYLGLAAGAPGQIVTNTSAPPTTTVPGTVPSAPVTDEESSNWSGYSSTGGPFTVVKGTFTVPAPVAGTSPRAEVAEWVGVDGTSASDPSLIQAGVDEQADPNSPSGFDYSPWWEILPATATPITTVTVNPGDKVTVTIWQVSGTTWEINLIDDTTGESFSTPPEHYTGPGSTAEWVVEATTECRSQCRTSPLAPYSPAVTFSDLGMAGPQKSLDEITMVQGLGAVSTPSAMTPGGFSVSYTGTSPLFAARLAA
jgi:hypothetical protein